MFKFPVYIDINELLGQFMSIRSTYQFYMSIFCFFFDMTFLCVDTLDISTLNPNDSPKPSFEKEASKQYAIPLGFWGSLGKALIHAT